MYFVPGMQHCSGGEGCDHFDKLGAITEWVSTGRPPARILSSHIENGIVTNTRPICPYPQVASYKGLGDPNNDANHVCTDTKPGYGGD
jgi:feruloyl esterase